MKVLIGTHAIEIAPLMEHLRRTGATCVHLCFSDGVLGVRLRDRDVVDLLWSPCPEEEQHQGHEDPVH